MLGVATTCTGVRPPLNGSSVGEALPAGEVVPGVPVWVPEGDADGEGVVSSLFPHLTAISSSEASAAKTAAVRRFFLIRREYSIACLDSEPLKQFRIHKGSGREDVTRNLCKLHVTTSSARPPHY